MHNAFYFPHDSNARNDQRVLQLRCKFGMEGYGIFWCILESMSETDDGRLNRENMGGLSLGYGLPIATLSPIVDFCIDAGLFDADDNAFWSPRMVEQLNMRKMLSEKGKLGAERRWKNGPPIREANAPPNGRKGEERRGKESKEHTAAVAAPDVVDGMEAEFRSFLPVASSILGKAKTFTREGLERWKARRRTFTAIALAQAFENLRREPDAWKLKHNGHRELSWWLHSDERIREMQNCHLKTSTSRPLHVAG